MFEGFSACISCSGLRDGWGFVDAMLDADGRLCYERGCLIVS